MKGRLFGLLLLVAVLASERRLAQAESPITLSSQEYSHSFADRIEFAGEFSSPTPITSVTLLFAAQDDLRIFTAELPVSGDQTQVRATYTLDLKEYPLRPFAEVEFWWRVENASGASLETIPLSFTYVDNRYDWQEATDDQFRVFWAADDPALGHTALRIAQDGLERMQWLLSNPLREAIDIYIYPSQGELASAFRLTGRDWIGGHADPEWGVILVSSSGGPAAGAELQRAIAHEVAHLVVYHSAGGKHNRVPFWLHEGLAVGNEPRPDPTYAFYLEQAREEDSLFPLAALCGRPSDDEDSALLAYAQSASLVHYLQNLYGNQQLRQLVTAFGDGADCSGGVERVSGLTLQELDANWRASLNGESAPAPPASDPEGLVIWVGLLGGAAALASTFYLLRPGSHGRPG